MFYGLDNVLVLFVFRRDHWSGLVFVLIHYVHRVVLSDVDVL